MTRVAEDPRCLISWGGAAEPCRGQLTYRGPTQGLDGRERQDWAAHIARCLRARYPLLATRVRLSARYTGTLYASAETPDVGLLGLDESATWIQYHVWPAWLEREWGA